MSQPLPPSPAEIARTNMVESQLRPNRVHNADLLGAMLNIPRQAFVPDPLKGIAYTDEAVKLAPDRYLTEPLITAHLLDEAGIEPHHAVLVIGGAVAYVAAVAAQLARHVVAVEDHNDLRALGGAALAQLGIHNVLLRDGAPCAGAAENGPFDVIVVDGAMAEIPAALVDQLAPAGRLVMVLAPKSGESHGILVERAGGISAQRIIFDGFTPYLPGCAPKHAFEFA